MRFPQTIGSEIRSPRQSWRDRRNDAHPSRRADVCSISAGPPRLFPWFLSSLRGGDPYPEVVMGPPAFAGTTAREFPPTAAIAYHTPPGRGLELAWEKCACTTRQAPASLRNAMVERVMNSSPP